MCYNKSSSIKAASIGILSSWLLYKNNLVNKNEYRNIFQLLAIFFAFVSLMQIYDAIFWWSLNDKDGKNKTNYWVTKVAMITNHLQPLVLAYLANRYIPLNNITRIVLYVYIFMISVYSVEAFNKITYTVVTKESAPALYWEWNMLQNSTFYSPLVYTIFLSVLSLISLHFPYPINYIMLIINLATFFFSKYTYKNLEIGRMWCHIAAYVPVFLLFIESIL